MPAKHLLAPDGTAGIDLNRRIGIAIRRLRETHGMTQAHLAAECGLTQAAVSQVERGRRGNNLNTLYAISTALGQRLDQLIRLTTTQLDSFDASLVKEMEEALQEEDDEGTVSMEEVEKKLGESK